MNILQLFINILLPPRCIKCGKIMNEHNGLCADCFNKIDFISQPYCQRCGRPFLSNSEINQSSKLLCGNCLPEKKSLFKMQRSAFIYNDESKNMILDFKFLDKTVYAETLANFLYNAGRDIWQENPDLLIPVPMHKLRLIKRRY